MACLIGEDGLSYVICLGEDVLMFLAMEWCAVGGFKWDWFGFGRLYSFPCLVHAVFVSFVHLRVVLLEVFSGRSSHPVKFLALTALIQVDFTG